MKFFLNQDTSFQGHLNVLQQFSYFDFRKNFSKLLRNSAIV